MQKELTVQTLEETNDLARTMAERVKSPSLIFLKGEMGSGKTHFAKAFVKASGSVDDTNSPTFTIINTYDSPNGPINHLDLYRLSDVDEFYATGLEDSILTDSISLIEWPELIEDELDPQIIITFTPTGITERQIIVETNDMELLNNLNSETKDE